MESTLTNMMPVRLELSAERHRQLKLAAAEEERPMAWIARKAVEAWIDARQRRPRGGA